MMQNWIKLGEQISDWILEYANRNGITTLVVGVSGGIDSAVTSALCAKTGLNTLALNMPIHQIGTQFELSNRHLSWLTENWDNVRSETIDLTETFNAFSSAFGEYQTNHSMANSRARLRMTALYNFAGIDSINGIVVGTGNKVEDFGVGFFTKYGDGGVDISPIADLYKSEVYALADALDIIQDIQDAAPTDGLWDDGRTDEEQIGATYKELEWAMREIDSPSGVALNERQTQVMARYIELNKSNSHKMKPIPVFKRSDR